MTGIFLLYSPKIDDVEGVSSCLWCSTYTERSWLYVPPDFYSKKQPAPLVCRVCVFCPCNICLICIYFQEVIVLTYMLECVVIEVLCTFVLGRKYTFHILCSSKEEMKSNVRCFVHSVSFKLYPHLIFCRCHDSTVLW